MPGPPVLLLRMLLLLLLSCTQLATSPQAAGVVEDLWDRYSVAMRASRDAGGAAVQLDGLDGGTVCLTLRRTACGGEGVSFNFGELSGCAAARPATLRRHERGSLLATFSAPSCRRGRLLNKERRRSNSETRWDLGRCVPALHDLGVRDLQNNTGAQRRKAT